VKKPLKIATSMCYFHADPLRAVFKGKTLQYVEQSMVHWLMSEGAMVYPIPAPPENSSISLESYVSEMDGLVLEGGSDMSPTSYGETPMKPEWGGDLIRDRYEIAMIKIFMAQKKPILGICRGAQVLNVAFGGSLYQDIETQLKPSRVHRNWEIYDQIFHELKIESGSTLEKLYGKQSTAGPYQVNTVHHQGVKQLGKDLKIEAVCPEDQIVEAFSHTGDNFVLGVQWHPEFQYLHNPKPDAPHLDGKPILREFLTTCEKRREK